MSDLMRKYRTPGVYHEDVFLRVQRELPTGIPGFVGFATPRDAANTEARRLRRLPEFDLAFATATRSYLRQSVQAFFQNGGVECYVAAAMPASGQDDAALLAGIESILDLHEPDLLCVPDLMALRKADGTLNKALVLGLQTEILQQTRDAGDRFAILDALPGASSQAVLAQRNQVTAGLSDPIDGALYYPWPVDFHRDAQPPCGFIAGAMASSDLQSGVFKAPANILLTGVTDLERDISDGEQGELNEACINCIRAFPGRGIRIWGARTLSRSFEWRYINIRRLFLMLKRWFEANMQWINFEPHTAELRSRILREVRTYLEQLWQAGALKGASPAEAFYLKCDAENNPSERVDAGQVVVEAGLAVAVPGEFVVVRILHRDGVAELA